jgi:hypothetical protein
LNTGAEKFFDADRRKNAIEPKKSKEAAMTVRLTIQSFPITLFMRKRAILCLAKLRRLVNGRVAAAISCYAYRAALPP